ncbi:MAG: sigma-54-dependent Fis family transcriptional regulator, partial [Candidatus Eisenbacteria bacterium]|nr:sigma-54-dependent Fis family transcriptional regulator [Candidatus Eisenbacteria bacterium]
MRRVLLSWIGYADLSAVLTDPVRGGGPIVQVLDHFSFDEVRLLCDYPRAQAETYVAWLRGRIDAPIDVRWVDLSSPTEFAEIYHVAARACRDAQSDSVDQGTDRRDRDRTEGRPTRLAGPGAELTLHLSPGTPAMQAVWILLGKTFFVARFVEASRERGPRTVEIPFDIAADFVPAYLRDADARIAEIVAGETPPHAAFADIVHRSSAMRRVVARAQRVALRSVPVLIEGESGTGKELFAKAIHSASPRQARPLVTVNCGAIPETLLESQLFGHERGAFTGAHGRRIGLFEQADGSTLFLDEIGELPLTAQVRLLRVVQEGEVLRVGSSTPIQVDVRIIAATNRSLVEEVRQRRFREDLFYRLAVGVLRLPPLREREGDLGLLVDTLLERVNEEGTEDPAYEKKRLTVGARRTLLRHPWLGNVRELLNTLRRCALWSTTPEITETDVTESLHLGPTSSTGVAEAVVAQPGLAEPSGGVPGADPAGTAAGGTQPRSPGSTDTTPPSFDRPLGNGIEIRGLIGDLARRYLRLALEQSEGN